MKKIFLLLITFLIIRAADAQKVTVLEKNGYVEFTRIYQHTFSSDSLFERRVYETTRIPVSDTTKIDALRLEIQNEKAVRKSEREKKSADDLKIETDLDSIDKELEKIRKGKGKGAQGGSGKKEAPTPVISTTPVAPVTPEKPTKPKTKKKNPKKQ